MTPRHVVILGYPGVQSLDVVGPYEVFAGAHSALMGRGGYRIRLVTADGQPVTAESGLRLHTDPLPSPDEPIDTLVLPGGTGVHDACAPTAP